ncbi:MAG: calcium/sodium antiporter [Rhodothermaceae bacterium]|nr:calcium/sodium antiporter [Rhodothermaceae bacterium]
MITFLLLLAGFVLLIKGADWLVAGASAFARKYSVSDLAIGLTIVAFGTSAPELVVNIVAAYQNHQEIVFSNIMGSNIFNLFAILGIAGIITPLTVQSSTVWKEIPISFFALLIFYLVSNDLFASHPQIISRLDGIFLLLLFFLFLYYVFTQLKSDTQKVVTEQQTYTGLKIGIFILLGLGGLIIGGRLIVSNSLKIAAIFNVSEKIIGLTIISIGTSLPELATSIVAALKRNNDIAVGNIIGSNIFNIFLILGLSSTIRPIVYNVSYNAEFYILAAGTIFLFVAMFTGIKKKLDRWEAGLLLISYIVYVTYLTIT